LFKKEVNMAQELSKAELLDKIEKDAYDYEYNYHGCSRSALRSLQDNLKLGGDDTLVAAASPLGGGMGLMGEGCGAVSGSLMAIGLAMGFSGGQDITEAAGLYRSVAAGKLFCQRVVQQEGSLLCRHLQARAIGRYVPLLDPSDYPRLLNLNVYPKCAALSGRIARLAAEFILEQREKDWADAEAENPYRFRPQ
jgi:C_GCAxxG_C_C family probable redox protein